jgi:hypothetical protein
MLKGDKGTFLLGYYFLIRDESAELLAESIEKEIGKFQD